jgi:HAD superfamily hydrolase (TIGR01509 family)
MSFIIPPGRFEAYLFDCDGTLADTMPLHYRAWRATLDPLGSEYPEDLFYELGGTPTRRIVAILNDRNGLSLPVESTARQKEEAFLALLDEASPVAPVMSFARECIANGQKVAVVTGSTRRVAECILHAIGAPDLFSTLIASEDVAHGKPAPDCYLEAARRLGAPPSGCLVFEDTKIGLAAAAAAGMQAVLVPRFR